MFPSIAQPTSHVLIVVILELTSPTSDPMASTNPYATSTSQPRNYAAPKRKRNKWLWIGIPLLLLLIIGGVLGGVLGTQLNKNSSSSSKSGGSSGGSGSGSGGKGGGGVGNTALPSGFSTNSAAATGTGANGEVYLAQATDTYMLPVYATGVRSTTLRCSGASLICWDHL